jgi:hypothetical protein
MFGFVAPELRFRRTLTGLTHSFSVLVGPINHIKHLLSKERLPFSLVYFGSLGLTLYFSIGVCVSTFMKSGNYSHPDISSIRILVR